MSEIIYERGIPRWSHMSRENESERDVYCGMLC
jgi:hypothetical protein